MKKKIAFFLFLSGFLSFCCPEPFFFDINGISISNFVGTNQGVKEVSEGSRVPFENHFFNVDYLVDYISTSGTNSKLNFINSAYAFTCPSNNQGAIQQLDTIVVITQAGIDELHPAGSGINDIVEIDGISLIEYLEEDSISIPFESFSLKLSQRPRFSDSLSISIYLKLTDGEEYTTTSDIIFLTNELGFD